ncbi:unnamed protein product [Owenia fusiformis]|uniref:Large ribosomal subunit protein mL40 n=1 Tax=Owenia fusiformis TaxID=6347 RepID=A0A8J1XTX9_OWEFU|nr:unnamed protein product [Owenia fusiformis]
MALLQKAFQQLSRIPFRGNLSNNRTLFTQTSPTLFKVTDVVSAEPLKKRRRTDPQLVAARDAKRKRRIEKAIKKLMKTGRKLKPVDEIEGDRKLQKEKKERNRELPTLSNEQLDNRAILMKEWNLYKGVQYKKECASINTMLECQAKALSELKLESEELYMAAIQVDYQLLPYEVNGPVRTPPIKGYDPPDGEYTDTTKTYEVEIGDVTTVLKQFIRK